MADPPEYGVFGGEFILLHASFWRWTTYVVLGTCESIVLHVSCLVIRIEVIVLSLESLSMWGTMWRSFFISLIYLYVDYHQS